MDFAPFNQPAPALEHPLMSDSVLRSYLQSALPEEVHREVLPSLEAMAAAAQELYPLTLVDRENEPRLTHWDAWGERVDRIELTEVWKRAEKLAAEAGVVATAYDSPHGQYARIHQFALAYLFAPSTDVFACPLAMTDGAARTLLDSGNRMLIDRAVPHLTSRDPAQFWTSGQWMTESTGGSDVGLSETVAREEDGVWRLFGRKWFTSAAASQMAVTLARPEGNPPGGRGLALFYVETRNEDGRMNQIEIARFKDKMGTKKLPTAELYLRGARAELVGATSGGVRAITPMLNVTRTWNTVVAVSAMRRGLSLARDYARRRHAFGANLIDKPLHQDTLAALQAEFEGAFLLGFKLVELLGKYEASEATEDDKALLRILTPLGKLTTGKQSVGVLSEVLEAFGGAGYVEDTGIPAIYRDAQVLPIWEGTTNVLSLDALRALRTLEPLEALGAAVQRWTEDARGLEREAELARRSMEAAGAWLKRVSSESLESVEAGARAFALTLGRTTSLALLIERAKRTSSDADRARLQAAARRYASHGVNLVEKRASLLETDARILAEG